MDINRSDWLPWSNPTYMPGSPHNLPSRPDPAVVMPTTSQPVPGDSFNVRENYRYASLVTVSMTVGTSSIKFLDQPIGKRNFLGFRNASATQNLYIEFNGTATVGSWLLLVPGQFLVLDTVVPQDDLYVVSDAVGATFAYAYSTFPG